MIDLLALTLMCGMGVFVLLILLKDMEGPFHIFKRLRQLLGFQYNQSGQLESADDNFFVNLWMCHWCLGTWLSAGLALFTVIVFAYPWFYFVYLWLGGIAVGSLTYHIIQ